MQRLWDAAYDVATTLEKLSRLVRPAGREAARGDGVLAAAATLGRTELRARMREEILGARTRFTELMNEREAYRALFPLVAYVDEIMQLSESAGHPASSVPLQKELFEVTNAGELFFESLDELLESSTGSRFTLEVYLYCLKLGYQGRHAGNPEKLEGYERRIAAVLCEPLPEREEVPAPEVALPLARRHTAIKCYAGAALLLAVTYLGLGGLSRESAGKTRPEPVRYLAEGR